MDEYERNLTVSTQDKHTPGAAYGGISGLFPARMFPDFEPGPGELGVLHAGSIAGVEAAMEASSVAWQGMVRLFQREQEAVADTLQSWRRLGEVMASARGPADMAEAVEAVVTNTRTRWVEASRDLFEIAVQWQEDAWSAYWAQIQGALESGEKIVESSRKGEA